MDKIIPLINEKKKRISKQEELNFIFSININLARTDDTQTSIRDEQDSKIC